MLLPLLHHHFSQLEDAAGASDLISRFQAESHIDKAQAEFVEPLAEMRLVRLFDDDETLLVLITQAVVTGAIH